MSGPAASIEALVKDGTWFAHRYDPQHDAVHFVRMSRETHRNATFLTDEYLPRDLETVVVARQDAVEATGTNRSPHFIFHSAFCCSTLLARALDIPGVSMGLKEPPIFNDIVGWRHRGGGPPARIAQVIDNSVGLLARPLALNETAIIKPSNLANGLARGILAMRAQSKALLLYAPLEVYLRSIAKKEMTGRLWVRDLLVKQLKEGLVDFGFEPGDYIGQTDLQVAAVGWLAQQALFAKLTAEFGQERVRTLDSETLLMKPTARIEALNEFYGLGLTETQVTDIVSGPAFSQHSKFATTFGSAERSAEYAEADSRHRDEIEKVIVWAKTVAKSANVSMKAPNVLA